MSRRPPVPAALLVACALSLGIAGCGAALTATDLTAGMGPAEEASLEVANEPAVSYDLALGLLRTGMEETPEESVLVSPLSVATALALAENGAEGETLAQMERATGASADELTDALQAYLQLGSGDDPLSLASSVWLRDSEGLHVEDAFLETCAGRLGAQVFSAPFDDSTVEDVNAWTSEKTHGMITNPVSSISPEAQLMLVSALAFEGTWEEPFEDGQIGPDTFTRKDGTEQDVQMMRSIEAEFLEGEFATGFVKPYEDYRYAFVGLLPNEGVSVDELAESLDGEGLEELLVPVTDVAADVGLPQFTSSYETELSNALKALGVTDAFDPARADFSRMGSSDAGPLYIDDVLHKTYVDVNEEGTRAAAATVVMMGDGGSGPLATARREVVLDRPFLYLIIDYTTRTPLFIGVVRSVG